MTVGEASELERLPPYGLRQFGIEEIARIGLVEPDENNGLGETGRAAVSRAIVLARDLRATEFVLMIPWGRERLLAGVTSALRLSPLSVKLIPDSRIRELLRRQSNPAIDPMLMVEVQREPLT